MNQNISQALKSQLGRYKQIILTEQKTANQDFFKRLIKVETTKLLQTLPKGVDKTELLTYLKEVFGKENFSGSNYKGGLKKEGIIAILEDKFKQEQKTTLTKTKELFGGESNFDEKGYKGGWNNSQDLKNIQGEQNKVVISVEVEQKLGGKEKFQGGVYQNTFFFFLLDFG